jgi:hypothetical protein
LDLGLHGNLLNEFKSKEIIVDGSKLWILEFVLRPKQYFELRTHLEPFLNIFNSKQVK